MEEEVIDWKMTIDDICIRSLDDIRTFSTEKLEGIKQKLNLGVLKENKKLKLAKIGKIAKLIFGGSLIAVATGLAIAYGLDPSQFAGENMSLNLGIQYGCGAYWTISGIRAGKKERVSAKQNIKIMGDVIDKIDEVLAYRNNFNEIFPEYAEL